VQFGDTGAGTGRYRLLETVRQHAAGRLDALGPTVADAARIAHRDHYLALAETAAPQLTAADQGAAAPIPSSTMPGSTLGLALPSSLVCPGTAMPIAARLQSAPTGRQSACASQQDKPSEVRRSGLHGH
jgi:hypothetical protein